MILVLEESPNYLISMNVRSMNEIEDCPEMLLRIAYPEGYPNTSLLQIEYDEESESFDQDDYDELDTVLKGVVRIKRKNFAMGKPLKSIEGMIVTDSFWS